MVKQTNATALNPLATFEALDILEHLFVLLLSFLVLFISIIINFNWLVVAYVVCISLIVFKKL